MVEQGLDVEGLRRTVANLVEEDPGSIGEHADLFILGLDSVVLMQLVGRWRQGGIEVNFAELAENPTIDAWAKLLSAREPAAAAGTWMDARSDADVEFPLAVMQHAYWIGRENGQWLGGVAAHLYTEFDGVGVDSDRLHTAIERLVTRHDMLRARFTTDGQQRIETTSGWHGLTVHDLRDLDHQQSTARLESIRDRLSHQMLDIERGEVFCTALSLLPDGQTRLHLDVDMVAADAVSYRILLADVARLYEQPDAALPAVGYSYREYRIAHPESRKEAARQAAEWWQGRLPDLPGAPELPLVAGSNLGERSGPARISRRYFMLAAQARAALTDASRRRGLTPAMVVATAFAEVLGAWSAQPRFLLNVPLFDREQLHPDVDKLVGDFTNSVLLEVDLTEPVEFVERVRRVQSRMHTDVAHADYSGVEVLRDLARHRGEQVFAPVVFTSALSLGELFDAGVRRSFGDPVWIISQNPQVLLDAQITEISGGLLVNWDVREQEFADGVVDAMFAAFEWLVHQLAENDTIWKAPVDDLLPCEQRRVRAVVNNTGGPGGDRLLHEGFFAQAERCPDQLALAWGEDGQLSYGELAQRALQVAGGLRERGVRLGDLVGVSLPKSVDQVAAVLGVLAVGGAYVPVGLDQPPARRARIYADAGVMIVLTGPAEPEAASWPPDLTRLDMPTALASSAMPTPVAVPLDALAYVIYTSGSTGAPKGVEITHQAAVNTCDDICQRFVLGPSDRVLAVSALDFDLSVFDLFGLLGVGGAVVLVEEADRRDAARWAELVQRWKVSLWNSVPTLLDMLLTAAGESGPGNSLRVALVSGDWVGLDLKPRLAAAVPGCRLIGLGGATEAAIWSNAFEVTQIAPNWRSIPYGYPLRNQQHRVVDQSGRDRPDWVPGELWIGGLGVAQGYRADPARTAQQFVIHNGQRWYRTGDQGRYWPDGTLEFLGRTDHQAKIRGHRIELSEIEAALRTHEKVGHAVAAVIGERTRQLAAAVTAADPFSSSSVDLEDLCRWAADRLPGYMVPERLIVLDNPPITRNGKLDRREIHRLLATGPAVPAEFQPTQGAIEEAVARIWSDLLEVQQVGRTDSFFALGGDSLLATRVISRLRDLRLHKAALGMRRNATIADLYRYPTVASLAAHLGRAVEESGDLDRVVARARLQRRARQSRAAGSPRRDTKHSA
ncbi:MAG: amino acid adenylation domain-containing protein [Pseudonocardiaceae bacterium]